MCKSQGPALLRGFVLAFVAVGVLAWPQTARALNPNSPEVKRAIDKGLKFLNSDAAKNENRLGGKCLIALAVLKTGSDEKHPLVMAATDACLKLAARDVDSISAIDVYSLGISIIYLCDLDPSRYHQEIEKLLQGLEKRQHMEGGWGYLAGAHAGTGDTSMTQYGVLATWAAHRHGVAASQDSVERVCNWLIRTQDPDGCWGYQGIDPGPQGYNGIRVQQKGNFMSLTAAACGASYICADLLNFTRPIEEDKPEEGLPPALKLVKNDPKQAGGKAPITKVVDGKLLSRARIDGVRWLAAREKDIPASWTYYYLYALERYQSFRELSEGTPKGDPSWYDIGARFIIREQKPDGSWESQCQPPVDTSFAILFLVRSTKKSIEKAAYGLGEGNLVGGQGLPQDLQNVKLKKGRVVARSLNGSIDDLLTRLEDPKALPISDLGEVEEITLSENPEERALELGRLRTLLMKGRTEARVAAAIILARSQELDNAPSLIFALGDPDRRVPPLANEGLKFISRRFTGYDLAAAAAEPDRTALKEKWKTWYRSIRPDGELPEKRRHVSNPLPPPPPPEDSAFSFLAEGSSPKKPPIANAPTADAEAATASAADAPAADAKVSGKREKPAKKPKRTNNDNVLWIAIGGGVALLLVALGALVFWPRGSGEREKRAAVAGAPLGEEGTPTAPKRLDDLGAGARSLSGTLGLVKETVNQNAAAFDNAALDGDTLAGLGRKRDERKGDAPVAREAVPKAQRWEIRWPPTSTEVYAQQLDFFGVELAAIGGGIATIDYGSHLGDKQPVLRSQPAGTVDNRLYFAHRSNSSRLDVDRSLLSSAGVNVTDRVILQFLPATAEEQLTKLEREATGTKKLEDILKTIFGVRQGGQGFEFYVIEQRMRGSS